MQTRRKRGHQRGGPSNNIISLVISRGSSLQTDTRRRSPSPNLASTGHNHRIRSRRSTSGVCEACAYAQPRPIAPIAPMPVVASVPASPSTAIDAGVAGKPCTAIDAGRSIDAVATSNHRTSDTSAAYARTAHIGTAHTGTAKVASANTCAAKISSAHTGTAKVASANTCAAKISSAHTRRYVLRSALPPMLKKRPPQQLAPHRPFPSISTCNPPALLTYSVISSIYQSKQSCLGGDQLKEKRKLRFSILFGDEAG